MEQLILNGHVIYVDVEKTKALYKELPLFSEKEHCSCSDCTYYEKAQEQEIFATHITYDTYKGIAEDFVNAEEFETMMFNAEENDEEIVTMAYGAYAAKMIQYVTPLSPVK